MNLLITGGTGFFGRAMLRSRLHAGSIWLENSRVTVMSRAPEKFLTQYPEFLGHDWLDFHAGDVLLKDSLPFRRQFTHIIHAAADSTLGPTLTPLQRYDQIVTGTRNMLDYAVATGAGRFLLASSGGVYGNPPKDMDRIPETFTGMPDPLNPANAYGVAKREAEHLCALYADAYGLDYVVARCFTFVGRDLPLDVHFAIGNFIRDAMQRDVISVAGDGSPIRSYMAQEDLAAWLLALLQKGDSANAYNVGSDKSISILELAHFVRDIISPEKPVRVLGGNVAGSRNIYVPDITKASNGFGLEVSISLRDAILAAFEYFRGHA